MKKRLEAELISIAHRILKLKNKSEVDQLYLETQKLYETLSVLKFYNENFEQLKSEVSQEQLEVKLDHDLTEKNTQPKASEIASEAQKLEDIKEEIAEEKKQTVATDEEAEIVDEEILEEKTQEEPVIVGKIEVEDEDAEEVPVAEAKDDLDFEPIFEPTSDDNENQSEEVAEEKPESKSKPQQISFEDLLGNYTEPVFVKPNDVTPSKPIATEEPVKEEVVTEKEQPKPATSSDKFTASINVGLNDRIAFVKNLFADSSDDFNRVLSQLNTFETLSEAKEFIDDMVKPDYNDWKGKEEYEERFMEIVEKKFA